MLKSYWDQLQDAASLHKVRLLDACINAGIPTSTFYRWRLGEYAPSHANACRVMQAIKEVAHATRAPGSDQQPVS